MAIYRTDDLSCQFRLLVGYCVESGAKMTAEELRRVRDKKLAVLLSRYGLDDSEPARAALGSLFDDLIAQFDVCFECMEKGHHALRERNKSLEGKVMYYEWAIDHVDRGAQHNGTHELSN